MMTINIRTPAFSVISWFFIRGCLIKGYAVYAAPLYAFVTSCMNQEPLPSIMHKKKELTIFREWRNRKRGDAIL